MKSILNLTSPYKFYVPSGYSVGHDYHMRKIQKGDMQKQFLVGNLYPTSSGLINISDIGFCEIPAQCHFLGHHDFICKNLTQNGHKDWIIMYKCLLGKKSSGTARHSFLLTNVDNFIAKYSAFEISIMDIFTVEKASMYSNDEKNHQELKTLLATQGSDPDAQAASNPNPLLPTMTIPQHNPLVSTSVSIPQMPQMAMNPVVTTTPASQSLATTNDGSQVNLQWPAIVIPKN